MARQPFLPRGAGGSRRSFEQFVASVAKRLEASVEEVYVREAEIVLKDLIDTTPISTGAAAGVAQNSTADGPKRNMYVGHPAYGRQIFSSLDGSSETGWQFSIKQDKNGLTISIVNPMWDEYLKYLEYGVVTPIAPAKPHFVANAWANHLRRRVEVRAAAKEKYDASDSE